MAYIIEINKSVIISLESDVCTDVICYYMTNARS